ncbi:MAG TPA: DUF1326 domain-containing protein [Isosphaeraceae bacterium]|nr:DUF1326 domain-containing protein [Isosphaeraceae bacterium]
MFRSLAALCGAVVIAGSSAAGAAGIRGDYIEARTADVYTGPCFSNAEIFIDGNQAVLAWKVTEGSFQGVDLSGLSVAAAVKGSTTFSVDRPEQARAVLIVDERADAKQREALVALAKSLAGDRLSNVVDVKTSRISLKIESHSMSGAGSHGHRMPHAPRASFWAPGLARIVTRPLDERDHFCGNEVVAYPPLSKGTAVLPAYTLGHQFKGEGLNGSWDDPNCRSSFVGHFAL